MGPQGPYFPGTMGIPSWNLEPLHGWLVLQEYWNSLYSWPSWNPGMWRFLGEMGISCVADHSLRVLGRSVWQIYNNAWASLILTYSYSILHVVCHSITVNRKRSTYKSTSYITTAYKLFSTILGEVLYRQAEIWESCMVEEGGGPPNFLYKAHGNWTTWCNFGLFLFGQCYISGQTQGPSAIPGMAVRSQLYCIE